MASTPNISFNDGRQIPQLGLGVWQIPNEEVAGVIHNALDNGYRSIDTAAIYGNEEGVGEGIRTASVSRDELFITTKVWNDRQGFDETLRAADESLKRLGLESVDLYLIHWPAPARNAYVDTWRAMIRLKEEGRAKSIGVSNFHVPHLQRLFDETGVVPVLNQIELHPLLQQKELREFNAAHGIVTESWSPLARAGILDDPTITGLAQKHGKTPAQIILRWHIELGLVVIPKSVNPQRIRENIAVFDFQLDTEDLAAIERLDRGERTGLDPDTFS
jgi:2,5-diketo-D-gluconate reductase A